MIQIAPAAPEDIEPCVALLSLLFTQEAEFVAAPEKHRVGLETIISQPHVGRVYCAREDGRVVGMVCLLLTVSTALGAPVAWLEDLVVALSHRGRGIGSALMDFVLAEARRLGLARVTLLTDADNQGAQRLYERCGFRQSRMLVYRFLPEDGATLPPERG